MSCYQFYVDMKTTCDRRGDAPCLLICLYSYIPGFTHGDMYVGKCPKPFQTPSIILRTTSASVLY